jgi:uncharacterized membrane protein YoaT (DUF817 family)
MSWEILLTEYKTNGGLIARYQNKFALTIEVYYSDSKKHTFAKVIYPAFLTHEYFIETQYLSKTTDFIMGDSLKVLSRVLASYKKEAKGYIQAEYDEFIERLNAHYPKILTGL